MKRIQITMSNLIDNLNDARRTTAGIRRNEPQDHVPVAGGSDHPLASRRLKATDRLFARHRLARTGYKLACLEKDASIGICFSMETDFFLDIRCALC